MILNRKGREDLLEETRSRLPLRGTALRRSAQGQDILDFLRSSWFCFQSSTSDAMYRNGESLIYLIGLAPRTTIWT